MDRIKQLNVFYHEDKVGTLALYKEHLAAFEYDKEWIIKFPSYDDKSRLHVGGCFA